MFDLTGRVAVVTGGSSGLGVVFAKALARQGADIVLLARRKELLRSVSSEIENMGRKCMYVTCDITDTADLDKAVLEIEKRFERVDILVANAGVQEIGPSEKFDDEKWNKVVDTDLTGVFKTVRVFAGKFMIPQKYGRIISISSMYGIVGNNSGSFGDVLPMYSQYIAYHASKAGVINLTRALGAEWAKYNITVNCIAPGYIASGFSDAIVPEFENVLKVYCPMKRLGRTDELESAIIYYACDESSFTTGTTLAIDGGWTAI